MLDAAVKTLEDAQTAGSVGEYEGQHPQSAADALRQAIDDYFSGRTPKFVVPELRDLIQK